MSRRCFEQLHSETGGPRIASAARNLLMSFI